MGGWGGVGWGGGGGGGVGWGGGGGMRFARPARKRLARAPIHTNNIPRRQEPPCVLTLLRWRHFRWQPLIAPLPFRNHSAQGRATMSSPGLLRCVGLVLALSWLSLGLVLALSWPSLGVVVAKLAKSWRCLGLVSAKSWPSLGVALSCLSLVLALSWRCLGLRLGVVLALSAL